MISPEQALSDFIDAWNAGRRPRVDACLAQVPEAERDALAGQLAAWLAVAPPPAYDAPTRASIRADPRLQAARRAAEGPGLPARLPRLRARAGLGIGELAARVTAALDLAGQERRAAAYLDRLERGDLEEARLSRRLLGALGDALDAPLSAPPAAPAAAAPLFRAEPGAEAIARDLEVLSALAATPAPEPMDELDRLFLGGPDA